MPITNVSFTLVCGDANDASRRESVEKGERMRLQVESEMGEKQEVGPNQQEFGRSFATCVTSRMPREIPAVKLGPIETGEERMSPDVIYSARATTQREQQQIRYQHVHSCCECYCNCRSRHHEPRQYESHVTITTTIIPYVHPSLFVGSLWHNCLIKSTASGIVLKAGPNEMVSLCMRKNISPMDLATKGVQPHNISYMRIL